MVDLYPRWQEGPISDALKTRRVLLLVGPRQCGKTTLAIQLINSSAEYRTLDDQTLRQAAEDDPHGFVTRKNKALLIIDEIQRAPNLLPAIKKAVDEDTRPGQFLLTGSANVQSLPGVRESLAGRVRRIRLRPLTQGEFLRGKPQFLDRAFAGQLVKPKIRASRADVLEAAFRGGFPEAARTTGRDRASWHTDYIDSLLEKDLADIARIQRQDAMRELVRTLAGWSSKYMDVSAIGAGLSIRRPTLESYINALEALFLVERVEPWVRTDYERVGRQRKLFMTDCGLMASILGWRMDQVRLDSDRSGKLAETFAFNELAAQADAADGRYRIYHYRDREKREIDFLIEREDGALLGVEIKIGATVRSSDFQHMRWFAENLASKRAFTGVILFTGETMASFGKSLSAVPFGALWN